MQDSEMVGNTEQSDCPFCSLADRPLIAESAHCIAFLDGYPVSQGHALVVPRRHSTHYFEMTPVEKEDLWKLVDQVVVRLKNEFLCDSFNVGFNVGTVAGQTVFHTHVHIIPRYQNDVDNPRGGVRNVIPGRGNY
jgi:ATP adenylyltransferase